MRFSIILAIVLVFVGVAIFKLYQVVNVPDGQCTTNHTVTSIPPAKLITFMDYFAMGDYQYEKGDCQEAIVYYTRSIELNPNYPQAYNNRGYTFMRMQDYPDALLDFNTAIDLNPNYAHALMNRGDIYNYYGPIDRQKAVVDYDKVISLGAKDSSVCGHKAMAESNNLIPLAFLKLFAKVRC